MDARGALAYLWPMRLVPLCLWAIGSLAACLVDIAELRRGTGGDGGAGANGAGGIGGEAGNGGGGGGSACPDDMVHAQHPDFPDVSFCIDETEVTQAAYVAFLLDVGDVGGTVQPPECAFNTELTRTGAGSNCPSFTTANDLPVNCVDWCDAYAYCAWAGKRLCGALGDGGPLDFSASVTNDEWHFACTGGFQKAYPYGDSGQICACYIPEEWTTQMMCDYQDITNLNHKAPVASHPGCEGGFDGIFDMQGNASEWTARCEPGSGVGDEHCVARGGTTYSVGGSSYYRCDLLDQTYARNDPSVDPGIRCCRDAYLP